MGNDQQKLDRLVGKADVIVQKFVEEINEGEVSLLFFNKKFSHAVLKKARPDDFRVQNDFGGTAELFTPSRELITQGEKIVSSVSEPLLYARVDGVVVRGRFILMELELIEPVLFFELYPEAAKKLAQELFLRNSQ
jgi:glutathione synthase/RimK-type ligase-like ATP-grasp enzyme